MLNILATHNSLITQTNILVMSRVSGYNPSRYRPIWRTGFCYKLHQFLINSFADRNFD